MKPLQKELSAKVMPGGLSAGRAPFGTNLSALQP